MKRNKRSTIPSFKSVDEFQKFWDTHDVTDFWDKTREAHFNVVASKNKSYFAVDSELAKQLYRIAERHGISTETLINLWIKEKISQIL